MSPRSTAVLALLLVALLLAVFAPVSRNGFIALDDDRLIYENAQVRQGLTAQTARWALRSTENANWYPLTRLTHLADASLFGMRAGGHHLMSLAWHAAAVVLLLLALRLMTGALVRSAVVAALFAVHPLQVESIAWAAERSMLLAGCLFVLSLLLWVRHLRRPGPGRYAAALVVYAAALASKPVPVTLPFALLLLDFWPLGRLGRSAATPWPPVPAALWRAFGEKMPFFLLAAGSSLITMLTQERGGAVWSLSARPLGERLGNAAVAYQSYLGKLLWPADLAVMYPLPPGGVGAGRALLAALLLAVLTALAIGLARRRPWLGVGWLWFLGMLLPMIGIVQVGTQAMADRYAYLPAVGLFVVAVWFVAEDVPSRASRRALLGTLAVVTLGALAAVSAAQVRLWQDDLTLFRHAIAATKGNWLAEYAVARSLRREGRLEESVAHYRAAVRDFPYDEAYLADVNLNLGNVLFDLRRFEEAVVAYREAARTSAQGSGALFNLGNALHELGRNEEAVDAYRAAVLNRPDHARAFNNLGNALLALGRYEAAAAACAEAVRLDPTDPVSRFSFGRALRAGGRHAEAETLLRDADRLRGGR